MKSRRLNLPIAAAIAAFVTFTAFAVAQNSVPLINQPLMPDAAKPGGPAFTLTVNGTGFVTGSVVHWNGSARTTTFVSQRQLKANILALDIALAGTASVTVVNPSPDGGVSNTIFFEVTPPSSSLAFAAASEIHTGAQPNLMAVADFNRDGKLDLAVPNIGNNNVSILLGNGDGTFRPPVNYPVGSQPYTVAAGDLNGDGKLDLAVSNNNSNTVSVLLGNGDGTFRPAVDYAVGSQPNSVTIADLNADGKLDLITSNWDSENVSVLLGNGDGTFQPAVDYSTGGASDGQAAMGDFNGDGRVDFAVTAGNVVCVFLGNGDGTFQPAVSYGVDSSTRGVRAADFNSDGKLDLVVANVESKDVSVLLGNGDGTFQPAVNYAAGSGPDSIQVGDFNGDGKLDLVIADAYANTVSVLLGNGDGTFQPATSYVAGSQANVATVGDFNGDGRLDFVAADLNSGAVAVLLQVTTVYLSPTSVTFADQLVGTTSPFRTATLTNTGGLTLNISSITVTGADATDFTQANTCGSRLLPAARCIITVTFTPTQTGPRTGSITITDDGGGSPQSVALSGTGVVSGPNATVSPNSLTFATQLLGTASPAQTVTLTDYGTVALSITKISFTGADPRDFALANTCGSSVAPGKSCTITVTFTPQGINTRIASLSITDNAPGSPQTVSLSGTGTAVGLNPTSLSFGVVQAGTTKSLTTTLTNEGDTTLSISGISVAAPFSETNTCGSSVGARNSCTITVTFRPTTKGAVNRTLSVSDNGGASPQLVSLSGTGCVISNHRCKTTAVTSPAIRSALAVQRTAAVPPPTGAAPVGTLVMDLADATRDDPFLADRAERELLVRFWYPASSTEGCEPAAYISPAVWSYFSQLTGFPLPEVRTNSCLNAPITTGTHPVVVFTHGYTGTFTDYTFLFEDLASRGYLVASIDHTYEATAVEFPDGRFVRSLLGSHLDDSWRTDDDTISRALSARLDDLTFVVNELERLNASAGNPFAGKLDLTRVALAGHSLGGLTAWLGLQREPRLKAAILLDPYLADIGSDTTENPVMLLTMGRDKPSSHECRLWSNLRGPRFSVNFEGAEHVTASDVVWLAKGAIKTGDIGSDKTIDALRRYIAAFLDANLRGKVFDPLLTGPSSEYPDATVIRQSQFLCGEIMKHSSNTDHAESR